MLVGQRDVLVDRLVDGRYRVLSHLADGGMGTVYVALDTRLDREVALKVMRPELARDPVFVDRFRREARAAARLGHHHAVEVYDQGEDDGLLFLAMELVRGRTLRQWLRDVGALTPGEALDVLEAVAAALQAAHGTGLVHRDVKPENVLVRTDGQVKVADFGLARAVTSATATGVGGPMLGTVAYLAPEQVEHGTADARSDIYACGLLLAEMLTGRPAVGGASPIHVAWQHVHGDLGRPSDRVPGLPAALDELVAWACRRDPKDRPADAAALQAAVRACRSRLTPTQLRARPSLPPKGAAGVDDVRTGPVDRATRPLALPPFHSPAPSGVDDVDSDDAADAPAGTTAGVGTPPDATDQTDETGETAATAATEPAEPGGASAASRPRGRRGRRVAAATALLLAGSGGAYALLGPPNQRTVPAVAGLSAAAAQSAVEGAQLDPVVVEAYSEDVARGVVAGADPQQGSVRLRGTDVTLTVSKGPERYAVPDVRGRTPAKATEAVTQARLAVGSATSSRYDEKVEAGKVVGTAPAVGTALRPGATVTLVVSKGRRPIPVGEWAGVPLAKATADLRERGLLAAVASREFSTEVKAGSVISQTPASGTLHSGDTVRFVVSKGPDLVTVPTVSGQSQAAAQAALRSAGFAVRVERIAGGLFGMAHSTDPRGGGKAPRGSTITLRLV